MYKNQKKNNTVDRSWVPDNKLPFSGSQWRYSGNIT